MSSSASAADLPTGDRPGGVGQGVIIVVTAFLPIMAIVSLAPAVPSILARFQGAPNATLYVPLMVSAPGLMIALLSPVAGLLTDRFGRRPMLLGATFLYGFFGVAPFFLDDLRAMFASRLALGVTEAVILTVVNTLIADYFDAARRRRWLTLQGVIGPVFGTSVIALSGLLTSVYWNGAFLIYVVAFPIFVAMLFLIFEPRRPAAASAAEAAAPFPWRTALGYAAVTLFAATVYYVFIIQAGLALQAVGVTSPARTGVLISIASVGVPVGSVIFGLISGRTSIAVMIALCLACHGAGLVGMGLSPTPEIATAFGFLQQVGAGLTVPPLVYWASRALPPEHRGRGMGVWVSAFFLGQFTSPFLVSTARELAGGILGAFVLLGAVAVTVALVGLAVWRLRGGRPVSL